MATKKNVPRKKANKRASAKRATPRAAPRPARRRTKSHRDKKAEIVPKDATACLPPHYWPTVEEAKSVEGVEWAQEVVGRSLERLGFVAHIPDGILNRNGDKLEPQQFREISYLEGVDVVRSDLRGRGVRVHALQVLKPLACVEVVEAETPEEFLGYLDIGNPRWGTEPDCAWIFRGQSDADWLLMPRAWRAEGRSELRPLIEMFEGDGCWGAINVRKEIASQSQEGKRIAAMVQRASEYEAVSRFARLADRVGLRVPNGDVPTGAGFLRGDELFDWSNEYRYLKKTVCCLAQHHGVPTALLDWTDSPLTAAFFAAEGADRKCQEYEEADADLGPDGPGGPPPGDLAVWAIDQALIPTRQIPGMKPVLVPVRCPRSEHSFLHAQDGLFLYYPQAGKYFQEHAVWPTLEDIFESHYTEGEPKPIRKVTLPKREATALLASLWRRGHSRARLMPTYDNVSASIRQRWRFDV